MAQIICSVNVNYFCFGNGHWDNKCKLEWGMKQITKGHTFYSIYNKEGEDGFTRERGRERAHTIKYLLNKSKGVYYYFRFL